VEVEAVSCRSMRDDSSSIFLFDRFDPIQ